MKMEKILDIKNLRVSYNSYAGEVQSVRGVSFYVKKGETVAIVGESGCGKSVTAKAIMGLIQTPPGEIKEGSSILYNGQDILKYTDENWQLYRGGECSIIFQDALTSLNPTLTIGSQIAENLILHKKLDKKSALEEAINVLKLVGINNPEKRIKQYPHEFSGGMRQRVMIAIALACNPKVLIADEPTTALDVTIQAQIIDLLKDLQSKLGISIILITHDLGVVASVADYIQVMYCGEIVESGTVREIFYSPKHPYTWALLNAMPRLDLNHKKTLISIEGTPPNLINPPKGCGFASRCKYCMNICEKKEPPVYKFNTNQYSACWLHHPMAKNQDLPFQVGGEVACHK